MKDYLKVALTVVAVMSIRFGCDKYNLIKKNQADVAEFQDNFNSSCLADGGNQSYCQCITGTQMNLIKQARLDNFKEDFSKHIEDLKISNKDKNECIKLDSKFYATLQDEIRDECVSKYSDYYKCSCMSGLVVNKVKGLHLKNMSDLYNNLNNIPDPSEEEVAACSKSDTDL